MDLLGVMLFLVVLYAWLEPEMFGHWLARIEFGRRMRSFAEVKRKVRAYEVEKKSYKRGSSDG